MSGVIHQIFSRNIDRHIARENATGVAQILGATRKSNSRAVIGERFCPYKVPLHTSDFWFTLFISDATFGIEANHKRPTPEVAACGGFALYFKRKPGWVLRPSRRLPKVSRVLGVGVFADVDDDENMVTKLLLHGEIMKNLQTIDFRGVSEFFVQPLQMTVQAELNSPAHCAKQAEIFRDLLVSFFHEAQLQTKSS